MKTRYLMSLAILNTALFLASCSKDIMEYQNDPRVYFYERANDLNNTRITSKSFSFLPLASDILRDTFKIKVKTMGVPADYDRVVRGKTVADSTTAVEGENYDFIDGIVKAGDTEGYLYVLLYRTADIKNKTVDLKMRIAETRDFKPGVEEDTVFFLRWSDNLVKPSNWDAGPNYFFGTYSNTKYRFIIDVLGITEFNLQTSTYFPLTEGQYSAAMMLDFKLRMKEALAAYNSSHSTPLTDENGSPVTFPN